MRSVDHQMNALTTDQPTGTVSYRGALAHLKTIYRSDIVEVSHSLTLLLTIRFVRNHGWGSTSLSRQPSPLAGQVRIGSIYFVFTI